MIATLKKNNCETSIPLARAHEWGSLRLGRIIRNANHIFNTKSPQHDGSCVEIGGPIASDCYAKKNSFNSPSAILILNDTHITHPSIPSLTQRIIFLFSLPHL